MLNASPIAPEVHATDIAEAEPKTRVHGVVIGGILAGDRRVVAADLHAVPSMQVGKVRPQHFGIAEDIFRQRFASVHDDQSVGLKVECEG